MSAEQRIKETALGLGAEKVGIASVADINAIAPVGHRPDDLLPGAQSVIVFAGRLLTRGTWRSPDYRSIFTNMDFFRIREGISRTVAKLIESDHGHYAIYHGPPPVGLNGALSFKLCAEMAGLGSRCMAGGTILNRELGSFNIGVCITTLPLEPDGPLQEEVCPHPSCWARWQRSGTTPCLSACPQCLSGELGEGRIRWMRYNRLQCSTRAQNMSANSLQRLLVEASGQADAAVRKTMLLGGFARATVNAIAYGAVIGQCIECLRNCPYNTRANKPGTAEAGNV